MHKGTASVFFELTWSSDGAHHRETRYVERLNFWRDLLPPGLEALAEAAPGERLETVLPEEEPIPPWRADRRLQVRPGQFLRNRVAGLEVIPRLGRWYPTAFLEGIPARLRHPTVPCRCVAAADDALTFDFNHPLAGRPLRLAAVLETRQAQGQERGGRCNEWALEAASGGPGLQALDPALRVDFHSDEPTARLDSEPDGQFYALPRMVSHIDRTAQAHLAGYYGARLAPGQRVLDLMSSWESHLPETPDLSVTGLGMNAEELAANPRLAERVVHDLNAEPRLPFDDGAFDAVICALSVEYLLDPVAVFREVHRVLRPGGPFLVTFSNRWFMGKVTRLWTRLHEFERMGLVLRHFQDAGGFEALETWSLRGLPRPEEDPYSDRLALSDPLYAVSGRRAPAAASG